MTRKSPRDFVHIDEFWDADDSWENYFFGAKVWVFADEYRAELSGDEAYSRIVIHSGEDKGYLFYRTLKNKLQVESVLRKITIPVSENQLKALGFEPWRDSCI